MVAGSLRVDDGDGGVGNDDYWDENDDDDETLTGGR